MAEQDIAPIDHSTLGATASTAAGAAGGALKGGAMTWLGWVALFALAGVALGVFAPAITAAASAGFSWSVFSGGVATAVNGMWGIVTQPWFLLGAAGLAVGVATSAIPTAIGAGIGLFNGGKKASDKISQERAAAMEMQMQMAASMPQPSGPQINNSAYQITPEEYVLMQSRMRGGEGVRADHAQAIQSERAAAELAQRNA